jgi:metal-responsive CopG/Arc/MetJ family transcriptional regulator
MTRIKVSVSVDPGLLKAVDEFVRSHDGADRSKVIDEALSLWNAARQDEAMAEQFAASNEPEHERTAWRATRRAAATRRFHRS